MKNTQLFLASVMCMIFFSGKLYSREAKPIPGKVVIKFKENSLASMQWSGSGRSGEIPFLKALAGGHSSRGYLSDNVLKAVDKRLAAQNNRRTSAYSLTASLARICVIEFSAPIDISFVISKLQNNSSLEYAEYAYERDISEIPNDPLYTQQRFLDQIKAFEAWDVISDPGAANRPLVAIVDTGIDYLHEDLQGNIYTNPGESGNDGQGRDKRSNGVDDDGNGFTDDWHGWDFVANNAAGQDNDPIPGHTHGTHVAGLVGAVTNNETGVASAGRYVKLLPVKVGPDDPNALSVFNAYEGITYAAAMGARIINCSWGGQGGSKAEQEITDAARALGSLIIAAAGNDGIEGGFYPAAYPGIISVAAVDFLDRKAGFSNYHRTVDISAPGENIFSTIVGSNYGEMSGTSMASPIVAGVAALVAIRFPNYTPLQIGEQLKATADTIDEKQPAFRGLIGRGRINLLRAVTETNVRSAVITSIAIEDENKDSIFEAGEKLQIFLTATNALAPLKNASLQVTPVSSISPEFIQQNANLGDMATGEVRPGANPIVFKIPANVPFNYVFELAVQIRDETGEISREIIAVTVRPSYRTFSANNITVTFNSEGNIGFNDYPENNQGKGFIYKNSDNLLYEGAFMAGISPARLSNVARNINQIQKDRSFQLVKAIGVSKPGILAVQEGETVFADDNSAEDVGISVRQKIYQFDEPGREDFVIAVYDIVNTSGADLQNFYAGLFFDWDLGPAGDNNQARFSNEEGFGYVVNTLDASYPWVGVKTLSHQPNFYAIDNDGSGSSINIYNGFSLAEKWATLQGRRFQSGVRDVSFVISAGPMNIARGDTSRVAFSLMAAPTYSGLRTAAANSFKTAGLIGIDTVSYSSVPDELKITSVYPNPATPNDQIFIKYILSQQVNSEIRIVDVLGKTVMILDKQTNALGSKETSFKARDLPQGQYFVQLRTDLITYSLPFVIF